MAILNIRVVGDPILTKKCKPLTEVNEKTECLIDDMIETMYDQEGVGLAAPQVGKLKRLVVIDVGEGPVVLINPEITETEGSQTGQEGCLSLPGKAAIVTRPEKVTVKAKDENMQDIEIVAEGLFARAVCHECDHLDGHMYTEIAESPILDTDELLRILDEEAEKQAAEEGTEEPVSEGSE